ncbi:MAG: AmmeMemoRadiSam system protein A [Acidobacteriota bacterium]
MKDDLDADEQQYLLRLARRAIEQYLNTGTRSQTKAAVKKFQEKRGAFVTLKVDGHLRGCIGYPLPYKPLEETIVEMAIAAATQDYRFSPLTVEELPRAKIEISVLTVPRPLENPSEVEVGRHGLIVSKGLARGLLLPQVPQEYGWDRETYLCHCCLKAGLEEDAWRKDAKVEVFEAQVFSE